jgi:hypothetical protein
MNKHIIGGIGAVILLIGAYVGLTMVSCTNPGGTKKLLKAEGYTDIEITGYRFLVCGDDQIRTGFKAKKNGNEITGTVCEGILKGKTIRYD